MRLLGCVGEDSSGTGELLPGSVVGPDHPVAASEPIAEEQVGAAGELGRGARAEARVVGAVLPGVVGRLGLEEGDADDPLGPASVGGPVALPGLDQNDAQTSEPYVKYKASS